VRNLRDHFCQEAPRILSLLLQDRLQPALPSGSMDLHLLDRICQWSTQECVTLVIQLLASGSGTTSRQPNAYALWDRPVDEARPSNSHSGVQLDSTVAAPQTQISNHTLPAQDRAISNGYQSYSQPSISVEPTLSYTDIISTEPPIPGYYDASFAEQHDGVVSGSMLDLDLDQLRNFVGQNDSSWGHSPIMYRAEPDHVYS
jgi:hypothetical protein